MVRTGRDAVQLCRARGVHGELRHVRARRRVCRSARQHGAVRRQGLRLGAGLRLHSDRSHQLRKRRPISGISCQRVARHCASKPAFRSEYVRRLFRRRRHPIFLAEQHPRHPRIELGGAADHANHHRHGGGIPYLVSADHPAAWQVAASTFARAPPSGAHQRVSGLVQGNALANYSDGGHYHRVRALAPFHELPPALSAATQSFPLA
jgi:hypothetical protein